ncbi:MAG: hypothetical protein QG671_2284 [Actinomycetota bacterium]|jgi:hypothetical protein|nr:hypothetical protein [Actinomycetota bacterium]
MPQLTTAAITHAYRDARRTAAARDHGMATRPDRDLRQAAWFAAARSAPWVLELAIQMAWFARSSDACDGEWNYRKLRADLDAAGVDLPADLSIHAAVGEVERCLERSRPRWYERNIALPMGRRAAAVTSGAGSLCDGERDDAGPTTRRSIHATDRTLDTYVVLDADLARAPHVLAQLARTCRAGADEHRADEERPEAALLDYRADVFEGAAVLASAVEAGRGNGPFTVAATLQALTDAVNACDPQVTGPATNPLVVEAGTAVAADRLADGDTDRFCSDIARAYLTVGMGLELSRPSIPGETAANRVPRSTSSAGDDHERPRHRPRQPYREH